jgi:hypothetical protein
MKHARDDYNRIQDPAGIIPDNEPVFLLRGQDICAQAAIGAWVNAASRSGASPEIIKAAIDQIGRIDKWQAKTRKTPDLPLAPEAA